VDVDLPHLFVARYADSRALPLFEKAASDRTLTAWICANDACGVCALRYLSGRRISVPGSVSVVGFDGSSAGLVARLSSYDFNIPALADATLRLVLGGEPRPRSEEPLQVDIPGLFVIRETVGRI
jgi:DNA-binding LacI/PurR family transcriptional regulator